MSSSAGIIIIGDEILSGRTKDININWIATELNKIGIKLEEAIIIQDDKKIIIEKVLNFSKRFTYVFTSGGIGPTHDDITTEAIATAFGMKLEKNKIAMELLRKYYQKSNIEFNEARQKMAIIPKGASLIDNPVSIAPGFNVKNVFVFAGVPKIMQSMFHSILNKLKGGVMIKSKTITCNIGEGKIANDLKRIEQKFFGIKIGSYPYFNPKSFGTSIVIRSKYQKNIILASKELLSIIKKLGGEFEIKD